MKIRASIPFNPRRWAKLARGAALPLALLPFTQAQAFDCNTGSDEICTLTLAPQGAAEVEIRAPGTQFKAAADASGFEIVGTVQLSQAGLVSGYTLYEAALVAEYEQAGQPDRGFRRLRGTAQVRNQAGAGFGMLAVGAEQQFRVDVGLELGSILQEELNILHLNPNRPCKGLENSDPNWRECPYWIFRKVDEQSVNAGFGGTDVGLNLSGDAGRSDNVTFLMDPEDFFMYVGFTRGEMDSVTLKIEPTGEAEDPDQPIMNNDRGLGFSQHGYIPFSPATGYGIEHQIDNLGLDFQGHLVIDWANIPLGAYAKLDGSFVFKFPWDELTGQARFDNHFQGAGNGNIKMDIPLFSDVLSWEMALGSATAGVKMAADQQVMFISGDLNKDFPWKPEGLPLYLDYRNNYQVAAVFVNDVDPHTPVPGLDVTQSYLQMEGEYLLDFGLGKPGSGFGHEVRADGFVMANFENGIEFMGRMGDGNSATAIHPLLSAGRDVSLRLAFNPWKLDDTLIELVGSFTIGGETYKQQGIARITEQDAYVGFPADFDFDSVLEAYHDIQDATRDAEAEVDRLQLLIDQQRAVVQAERDAAQADVAKAQADVNYAQSEVDKIRASMTTNYNNINYYKSRIGSWKRWYNKQPWYNKTWAWSKYLAQASYYNGLIAAQYTAIAAKEVALATATAALNVAKAVLSTAQQALVYTPIDLDPRVAPLIAAKESALGVLNGLQTAMPEIPEIPGTIKATVGFVIDGSGLTPEARAEYCDNGECIEIKGGSYDRDRGLACITLPTLDNRRVCTAVPVEL